MEWFLISFQFLRTIGGSRRLDVEGYMEVRSVCDPARTKGGGHHMGKIGRDADRRSWSQEELAYLLYWFGAMD